MARKLVERVVLTIRPRAGFERASVSRQPASAFSRPRTAGLRLGSFNRFHASSASNAKLDGSASRSIFRRASAAAGLDQFLDKPREDLRQMSNVGDGIIDLPLVERTSRPVRKTGALVEA
jgi:hypothetical protein